MASTAGWMGRNKNEPLARHADRHPGYEAVRMYKYGLRTACDSLVLVGELCRASLEHRQAPVVRHLAVFTFTRSRFHRCTAVKPRHACTLVDVAARRSPPILASSALKN